MTREEAIDKLKRLCSPEQMTALRVLVPELQESEDERHIKWILEYLYDGLRKADEQFKDHFKSAIDWLEKQKAKERLDRMAPIYNNKESFESALEKAWKYYNESASRTVDSFEDDYIECVFSKGFREGFLYREKQKEQKPVGRKPEPESLEALMYAIEGKWEMIKPTSYLSRRLEDLYEGLVNTFDIDEKYLGNLPKTEYTEKDIEEIKALKEKIDSSIETKPAEHLDDKVDEDVELTPFESALFSAFSDAWQEYMLGETVNVAHWAKEHSEELLEVVKEESAEWSEKDEENLKRVIMVLEDNESDWKELSDWLKSLRPQPKQKWNEKDEKRIKQLIYDTEHIRAEYEKRKKELGESFNDDLIKDCDEQIVWLKSLTKRFNLPSQQEWSEEAEKEKGDFVSGKFIECKASFNVFKEGKSYWLEYIGDDMYIGRSDNILNQKIHITPRQLFTSFSKEDCLTSSKRIKDDEIIEVSDEYKKGFECGKQYVLKYPHEFKAEWSEEDLQHKSWILECLADGERKMPEYAEDFRAAYKWLKSLRPQSHWKPSEEQMSFLFRLERELRIDNHPVAAETLVGIYKDLEKL